MKESKNGTIVFLASNLRSLLHTIEHLGRIKGMRLTVVLKGGQWELKASHKALKGCVYLNSLGVLMTGRTTRPLRTRSGTTMVPVWEEQLRFDGTVEDKTQY